MDPPDPLSGSFRLPTDLRSGPRIEKVPFPCHPYRHYAWLREFDPDTPVQYWEQRCDSDWMCTRTFRFEHWHQVIRWRPIEGLTDPLNPPGTPLDVFKVTARLMRERESA